MSQMQGELEASSPAASPTVEEQVVHSTLPRALCQPYLLMHLV